MLRLAPIALLFALLPCAGAQRMGAAPHFAPHFGGARAAHSFAHPIPFFSDGLYSDAFYPSGYGAAPPAVIVVQTPAVADPAAAQLPAPAQPLLIELQGDRYVRVSGDGSSGVEMLNPSPDGKASRATPAPEPGAAILVFRDGHREQISDYTIANGALYASSNYYASGSWNRKVELSSLDLPETIAANRATGLNFRLPSAPNEVIVGP